MNQQVTCLLLRIFPVKLRLNNNQNLNKSQVLKRLTCIILYFDLKLISKKFAFQRPHHTYSQSAISSFLVRHCRSCVSVEFLCQQDTLNL